MDNYVKKKKYNKKIFLMTAGEGKMKYPANNIYRLGNKLLMG